LLIYTTDLDLLYRVLWFNKTIKSILF